eukprot:scpid94791/ scgid16402/ 
MASQQDAHVASLASAAPQPAHVDALSGSQRHGYAAARQPQAQCPPSASSGLTCYRCGKPGHATCDAAKGQFCSRCGKPNHFAAACRASDSAIQARTFRKRRPHQHSDQHAVNSGHHAIHSLETDAELFSTDFRPRPSTASCREDARCTVHVSGIPLTVLVDSGA